MSKINIKMTTKGEKYLDDLLEKRSSQLTLDEDFRLPILVKMRDYGVTGPEMFTLLMVRHNSPYEAGLKLYHQMRWMLDNDYLVRTEEPSGYTEADLRQEAGPEHAQNIIDAVNGYKDLG